MTDKFIRLENVCKSYKTKAGWHHVLRNVTLDIGPSDRIGVVGRNGAGKSTLLRMVGGSEMPDSGRVIRNMSVSWPIGFGGHLQPSMSGRANAKFCARIYNRDPDEIIDFVLRFSELGSFLDEPFKTYSSGMKARLGFSLSMAIKFDCLLIDEVTAVGDAIFRKKCNDALEALTGDSAFVLINHTLAQIDRLCNKVVVLGVEEEPFISTRVHKTLTAYQRALHEGVWERQEAA